MKRVITVSTIFLILTSGCILLSALFATGANVKAAMSPEDCVKLNSDTFSSDTQLPNLSKDEFKEVLVEKQQAPEPATMLLFGSGLAALGAFGRRKLRR